MKKSPLTSNSKGFAYAGLILVILLWGINPLVTLYFYQYYSPTIRISFAALVCALSLLIISRKKLKLLNKTYFRLAIPTGLFMAAANVFQKIGLQYTTPAHYAFLENLSVIIVPILSIFFIKKRPGILTIIAAILCMASSFLLTGMSNASGNSAFIGDLLCASAGICYGVNIAATGAFAKKLYTPLYLMIQMFVEFFISGIATIVFHATKIESIQFDFHWRLIVANIAVAFITNTLCWLLRTKALRTLDASVVAVMSPFSAVITSVISILIGKDTLTLTLIISIGLGLLSIILSALGDIQSERK